MKRFKEKLTDNLRKALEDHEMNYRECFDKESVILTFIDKMIEDHKKALMMESQDVYTLSLMNYKNHLKDLE